MPVPNASRPTQHVQEEHALADPQTGGGWCRNQETKENTSTSQPPPPLTIPPNYPPLTHLLSKLYCNHPPSALRLSHLTFSSPSAISSITLVFNPNFSNCALLSGTSLTKHPTSLQAIASTALSLSHGFFIISASRLTSSPFSCSRMRRAFSAQKTVLRCGGDQRRWPELSSPTYSSKVVLVLVYSSRRSRSWVRSSRRSGSANWRVWRFCRSAGRRARTAMGRRVVWFWVRRLRREETRRRVVFSLGERRRSCV